MTNPIPISCVFGPILDNFHEQQNVCCENQTNICVILWDFLGFLSSALFSLLFPFFDQNHTNKFFVFCVYLERPNSLCYNSYFVVTSLFYFGMALPTSPPSPTYPMVLDDNLTLQQKAVPFIIYLLIIGVIENQNLQTS